MKRECGTRFRGTGRHNIIWLTRETNLNTDVSSSFRVVSTQISRLSFWKDDFQLVKVYKYFYFSESNRYVLTALNVVFQKSFYKIN